MKNYTLIALLWRQVRLVINYLTANYSAPKVRFSNIPFGLRKAKIRFAVYNSHRKFFFLYPIQRLTIIVFHSLNCHPKCVFVESMVYINRLKYLQGTCFVSHDILE